MYMGLDQSKSWGICLQYIQMCQAGLLRDALHSATPRVWPEFRWTLILYWETDGNLSGLGVGEWGEWVGRVFVKLLKFKIKY